MNAFHTIRFSQFKEAFEQQFEDFDLFWLSKPMTELKEHGLIVIL